MFGRRGEIEKLVAQLEQQRSRLEQVRERARRQGRTRGRAPSGPDRGPAAGHRTTYSRPSGLPGGVANALCAHILLPGTVLLDRFFGVSELDSIVSLLAFTVLSAFGSLLLTIFAGFAYDLQRQTDSYMVPSMSG